MLAALLKGDIDVASTGFRSMYGRNDTRMLMTCGDKRLDLAPDVPTYKEVFGVDPVVNLPAGCIFVPTGTPKAVAKKLHDIFKEAMSNKKFKELMAKSGTPIVYRGMEDILVYADRERKKALAAMEEIGMIK